MHNFNIGDTVQLKSGGPAMTVHYLEGGNAIECIYFNASGTLRRESFKIATIVRVKSEVCKLTGMTLWNQVEDQPEC